MRTARIALATLLVGLAACSSSSHASSLAGPTGQTLAGTTPALAALDGTFAAHAAAVHATTGPGATCWYETTAWKTVTGGVCGPLAGPGDPVDGHWEQVAVTVGPHGTPLLTLGPTGQRLADGTELVGTAGTHRVVHDPGAEGRVLPPGQVAPLDSPGIPLAAPADGRLASYDQLITVAALGDADTAGPIGSRVSAGPGRHLIVAQVAMRETQPDWPEVVTSDDPTVNVVLDGQATPIQINGGVPGSDGSSTFAVSVDNAHSDAQLQLTEDGLTQTFDLVAGQRSGAAYPALYRAATMSWLDNLTGAAQTASFGAPYLAAHTDPITPQGVFGAFTLTSDGPSPVTDPTTGVLYVGVVTPASGSGTGLAQIDPSGVHVSVVDPAGGNVTPTASNPLIQFAGFTVPAAMTRANVTIDPGALQEPTGTSNTAPITFSLTIPPASTPPPEASVAPT